MSRLISNIAQNRAGVRPGEKYGIEVEAEGCPLDSVPEMRWSQAYNSYWSVTGDGSLRNGGIEFLSKPLGRTAVRHAINALWPYFREGRMEPSVRTGIHIHASCLGLNTDHVLRILQHYALVEPALFAYVGPQREENIYCIPWYRSPDEVTHASQWLASWEPNFVGPTGEEPCKYSALYVQPLARFGTIEFRHAPTWTDADTMFRWWQMVQSIWRTHQTEYNVLDRFNELGPVAFCKSVLPFDFLGELDERPFEDADVDTVCSLLMPQQLLTADEWGVAPELRGRGVATPPRRATLDERHDDIVTEMLRPRATTRRIPVPRLLVDPPPSPDDNLNIALTVRVEDEPMPEPDDYRDDMTDEEREEF